jgi:tRNA 2-thiouridine synthesizing protein D
VKILIIVNESPWGGSLGLTALRLARLARAMAAGGQCITAVFFREDGIHHAVPGRAVDSGTPCLAEAWQALSRQENVPMLLCSSAAQRRLASAPGEGFREAGLAEVMELMAGSDRVMTF